MVQIPKTITKRNSKYLDFIRSTICIICLSSNPQAHHENPQGKGGKGIKTDDTRAIPLCPLHHGERHQIGKKSFAKKHKLNYEQVISELNRIYMHQTEQPTIKKEARQSI